MRDISYRIRPIMHILFKSWYEGARYLNPYDFKQTGSGNYKLYVEYKDRNEVITKFEVEMVVIGDKLKTISSVEVKS